MLCRRIIRRAWTWNSRRNGTALRIFGLNGGTATQLMMIPRASLTTCGARCIKVRLVGVGSSKWRGYEFPLSRTDRRDFKNPTPKSGLFILRMGFILVSHGRPDNPPLSVRLRGRPDRPVRRFVPAGGERINGDAPGARRRATRRHKRRQWTDRDARGSRDPWSGPL